jgi:hypothetical protein
MVCCLARTRGRNEEGWNGGRYGVDHDVESWRRYTLAAGFVELAHYYRPDGVPREQLAGERLAQVGALKTGGETNGHMTGPNHLYRWRRRCGPSRRLCL